MLNEQQYLFKIEKLMERWKRHLPTNHDAYIQIGDTKFFLSALKLWNREGFGAPMNIVKFRMQLANTLWRFFNGK